MIYCSRLSDACSMQPTHSAVSISPIRTRVPAANFLALMLDQFCTVKFSYQISVATFPAMAPHVTAWHMRIFAGACMVRTCLSNTVRRVASPPDVLDAISPFILDSNLVSYCKSESQPSQAQPSPIWIFANQPQCRGALHAET